MSSKGNTFFVSLCAVVKVQPVTRVSVTQHTCTVQPLNRRLQLHHPFQASQSTSACWMTQNSIRRLNCHLWKTSFQRSCCGS